MVETTGAIDCTACEVVERVPGRVSGQPVVRGTRVLPDPILRSYDRGETVEEIREGWPSLSVDQIAALIAFAHAQRAKAASFRARSKSGKVGAMLLIPGRDGHRGNPLL